MPDYRFPFGRPITPRPPSARGPRSTFILGAYPSALHVRWTPPPDFRTGLTRGYIAAIPVDDEPTPFWTGAAPDEKVTVDDWKRAVGFRPEWGEVSGGGNGTSGRKVNELVLTPLKLDRADCVITDCLDTYYDSTPVEQAEAPAGEAPDREDEKKVFTLRDRLRANYDPFAKHVGLPLDSLPPHPDEDQIVTEAVSSHRERLLGELRDAKPDLVITLGNAPLRVLVALVKCDGDAPKRLCPDEHYGEELRINLDGRAMRWLPLVHPRAARSIPAYAKRHDDWMKNRN